MPCAVSKQEVQWCIGGFHCFIKSHCSPCCSGGNCVYNSSIWHRPLLLHLGWTVLAVGVSSAGTCSLFNSTCGKGKEDESDVIYLHSWQCWTPISSWWWERLVTPVLWVKSKLILLKLRMVISVLKFLSCSESCPAVIWKELEIFASREQKHKHAMTNCLAWRIHSLQWWK